MAESVATDQLPQEQDTTVPSQFGTKCDGITLDEPELMPWADDQPPEAKTSRRDLVGFWLLGLTNNFAYVIMLSAAHDILSQQAEHLGTGIILLADILPTILIKLTAPFFIHRIAYRTRVFAIIGFAFGSYLTVSNWPMCCRPATPAVLQLRLVLLPECAHEVLLATGHIAGFIRLRCPN